MVKNAEFYTRAIADAPEILQKIAEYGSNGSYHNPGSVEWCPEVGASWVPLGRTGRYHTISFGYTTSLSKVLSTIEEDQIDGHF